MRTHLLALLLVFGFLAIMPTSAEASSCTLDSHTYTTCYYIDFTGGADSNDGLTTSTPWKHAPGMTGSTGNPAAIDPFGGGACDSGCDYHDDAFVFKGGVTWPRASLPWVLRLYGTSGHPVYYGPDPAWYTGAAWSKPIFDMGGSAAGPWCSWVVILGGGSPGATYVIFDKPEFTGFYWDATCQGDYLSATSPGIHLVHPGKHDRGGTFNIKVLGNGTSWVNATTVATFSSSSGITVNSTTVVNSTAAWVNITLDAGAALTARNVIMTTGGSVQTAVGGFTPVATNTTSGAGYFSFTTGGHNELKNCYMHGWSHGDPVDGTLDQGNFSAVNAGTDGSDTTSSLHDCAMDGYDARTPLPGGAYDNLGFDGYQTSGSATFGGPAIQYNNWYSWVNNGGVSSYPSRVSSSTFDHIGRSFATNYDPLTAGMCVAQCGPDDTSKYQDVHDQAYESNNDATGGFFFYNNRIQHVAAGITVNITPPNGTISYFANNLL